MISLLLTYKYISTYERQSSKFIQNKFTNEVQFILASHQTVVISTVFYRLLWLWNQCEQAESNSFTQKQIK